MNQNAQTKRPFPYVTVCLIVIAVLVCTVLVFQVLDTTGVIGKLDTAVSGQSGDYNINANELAVYEYQLSLSTFVNQYWYYKYGLMQDTYGVTKMYNDAYAYAYDMMRSYVGTDAFTGQAFEVAQQAVVFCEWATKENKKDSLEADVQAEVDTFMKELEAAAKSANMSLNSYIRTYMGPGISVKEVRSAIYKSTLGSQFSNLKLEELSDGYTLEELEAYKQANKDLFFKTYYHSYVLVDKELKEKAEKCTTVDEIKELLTEYMVEEKFESLYKTNITDKKVTDPNGMETTKAMVLETLLAELGLTPVVEEEADKDETTEGETEKNEAAEGETTESETTDAQAEESTEDKETEDKEEDKEEEKKSYTKHFLSTDKDDYKKAGYEIVKTIKTALTTETNKISKDASTSYVDLSDKEALEAASDLQKWLFGEGGKKAGDVGVIESKKTTTGSDGKTTESVTYTWCVVDKPMFLDTEKTKDAYYVKLSTDKDASTEAATNAATEAGTTAATEATTSGSKAATEAATSATASGTGKTAEQKAKEFIEALKASATPEKFDELALKYGAISEGGTALKENITEKSITSTSSALGEWLYAEGRKANDFEMFKSGSDYYVALFVEENEETWVVSARQNKSSEELDELFKEKVAEFKVEVDTKALATTEDEHAGHNH